MKKTHTSSSRYVVVLAGVQLVLQEASTTLNSLRKASKGKNFHPVERDIRRQLRLIKEAVQLAESELDNHVAVYDKAVLFSKQHPLALPDGKCPECTNPKCNGCCDAANEEE